MPTPYAIVVSRRSGFPTLGGMDTFFGLPAHPLLVHIPVVLVPLALVGVIVMVSRPSWWGRYEWATLVIAVAGAVGAVFAA